MVLVPGTRSGRTEITTQYGVQCTVLVQLYYQVLEYLYREIEPVLGLSVQYKYIILQYICAEYLVQVRYSTWELIGSELCKLVRVIHSLLLEGKIQYTVE
jgi:hypothetical protein